MLGLITFRVYIFIGLMVGGVMAAIWYFDTGRIMVGYVTNTGNTAAFALGSQFTGFVTGPIVWAMTDPLGAAVAGLLWPLAALWLIFLVALFVFSIFAPTIGRATQLP